MISFIIIGRNEGKKLERCIISIHKTIATNHLSAFEVIYVDSASTDGSIGRVKKYKQVRIFKITGKANPAVARNVGAKEAQGDVLFFIDGDMEIQPDFIPFVYDEKSGLKYNFVSGELLDYYYDIHGRYLYNDLRYKINKDSKYEVTTGGLFLIKKSLWDATGGMRSKYKVSEDFDLGLRLAKAGIKLCRINSIAASHHTVNYKNRNKMWVRILKGEDFYLRGVLYRDHILFKNKEVLRLIVRSDYTLLLLLMSVPLYLVTGNLLVLLPYTLSILLRSIPHFIKGKELSKLLPVYFLLRDIFTIFSFMLFFPKSKMMQYIPV